MKNLIIIYLFIFSCNFAYSQCLATDHSPVGPFVTVAGGVPDNTTRYKEEDLCGVDTWVLAFKDDFDGPYIDNSIWEGGTCNEGRYQICGPVPINSNNDWFEVSNGTLKMTSRMVAGVGNVPDKIQCPAMSTKQSFPAGKIQVYAKMPDRPTSLPVEVAPLWTRTTLHYLDHFSATPTNPNTVEANGNHLYYANEMDIEFFPTSARIK